MPLIDTLLAADGRTREDLTSYGVIGKTIRDAGIDDDEDFQRVAALPRRPAATPEEIAGISAALRKRSHNDDGEENLLRPAQVEALTELHACGGLFAPMRVGSGKTLVTLLAATVMDAERPVLILPASLRDKTRREFAAYSQDWHVRLPRLIGYVELGRPDRESLLADADPDLLILDEAHRSRNLDAAVSRRIRRQIEATRPAVALLSGTLITDKVMDYHHHAVWSLGELCPLPTNPAAAERWGQAVDADVSTLSRRGLGALADLKGGFEEWLRGSRGVVPTPGSDCDAAIVVEPWVPDLPEKVRELINGVIATDMRPDGEPLDQWDVADCLCQLALGFYYVWDPPPPSWWLRPRRGWRAYAKAVLDEQIEGFDSESPIVAALDRREAKPLGQWGAQPPSAPEGKMLLDGWRAVRDTFTPNPVPVWVDDSPLRQAIERSEPGTLIWTRYTAAGERLDKLGVPYFGAQTDPETAPADTAIALSIAAHSTGKNLQARHRSLVLTPMANAGAWEQLIGRTHRAGQKAPAVYVDRIEAIAYHADAFKRVTKEAHAITRASGFEHKLVTAEKTAEENST